MAKDICLRTKGCITSFHRSSGKFIAETNSTPRLGVTGLDQKGRVLFVAQFINELMQIFSTTGRIPPLKWTWNN